MVPRQLCGWRLCGKMRGFIKRRSQGQHIMCEDSSGEGRLPGLAHLQQAVSSDEFAKHTRLQLKSSLWFLCLLFFIFRNWLYSKYSNKHYPKQDKMALHPIPWSSVGFCGRPSSGIRRGIVSTGGLGVVIGYVGGTGWKFWYGNCGLINWMGRNATGFPG